ncbi:MAG: class I SAM-dependent methyltransferase [Oligoflexales bacterium]
MKFIATNTQSVYERNGEQFDSERGKTLIEKGWLSKFDNLSSKPASILDVGCGSGEPIARYLIEKGYELTGVDYAESMLNMAKRRFPNCIWKLQDMRQLDLGKTFDGIIAWHSFFHLDREEQRSVLPLFSKHLNSKGILLVTVGPKDGEVFGHVCGEKVYHSSLDPAEYRRILENHGINIVEFAIEDPSCDFATIILAQKH